MNRKPFPIALAELMVAYRPVSTWESAAGCSDYCRCPATR